MDSVAVTSDRDGPDLRLKLYPNCEPSQEPWMERGTVGQQTRRLIPLALSDELIGATPPIRQQSIGEADKLP